MSDEKSVPTLSIVIPAFNEEETLDETIRRVLAVARESGETFEIVFVDDGSADSTAARLADASRQNSEVRVVGLSRNFGHQAAVSAGLSHARGDAVVVMDADLQDPPEVVLEFLARWREGYEVVYGVRRKRKEGLLKRLAYDAFYRLLDHSAQITIPRDSGDFCLMDRRVVDYINDLPERVRFVRGLRAWVGLRQVGVEYERDSRHAGKPKYGLRSLYHLAATGIVSFSIRPLHLATKLGFLMAFLSIAASVIYFVLWLAGYGVWPRGFATLFIGICFLFGIQFILIGILGEYIGSIHSEIKRRPTYLVSRLHGFDEDAERPSD